MMTKKNATNKRKGRAFEPNCITILYSVSMIFFTTFIWCATINQHIYVLLIEKQNL